MNNSQGSIPISYISVTWRNTTPVEKSSESIGIGFDANDGHVLRLKLDIMSAEHLSQTISEYLEAHRRKISQSPKSPGSIPEEGQKVMKTVPQNDVSVTPDTPYPEDYVIQVESHSGLTEEMEQFVWNLLKGIQERAAKDPKRVF